MLKFYRDFNSHIVGVYQRDKHLVLALKMDADGLKTIAMSNDRFMRTYTHPVKLDERKAIRTWFFLALKKSRNEPRAFNLIEELFMEKQLNEMTMEELIVKHNEIASSKELPTVESFKSLKAARAAVEKLLKGPKAPKAPKPAADLEALGRGPIQGVGKFAKDLLLTGMSNKDVLAKVKEQFPSAKTSGACIAYYRTKLIAEGKLQSTRVSPESTPKPTPEATPESAPEATPESAQAA